MATEWCRRGSSQAYTRRRFCKEPCGTGKMAMIAAGFRSGTPGQALPKPSCPEHTRRSRNSGQQRNLDLQRVVSRTLSWAARSVWPTKEQQRRNPRGLLLMNHHLMRLPCVPQPLNSIDCRASCACGRGHIGPASPVVEARRQGAADKWVADPVEWSAPSNGNPGGM